MSNVDKGVEYGFIDKGWTMVDYIVSLAKLRLSRTEFLSLHCSLSVAAGDSPHKDRKTDGQQQQSPY